MRSVREIELHLTPKASTRRSPRRTSFRQFESRPQAATATSTAESSRGGWHWPWLRSWLVAFHGENRFRIGAGNFANGDPPEPADQRAC